MRLFSELKRVTAILKNYPGQWAICGGVAASIYRSKARFTADIDIALVDTPSLTALELASKAIAELGYKEYRGFVLNPKSQKQVLGLLCARGTKDENFVGLDFLLPVQEWVTDAVDYAQSNCIDYGFDKLPTITPESLIIAKLQALLSNPERFQDLDDIKEILGSTSVNIDFVKAQIEGYDLELTANLKSLIFGKSEN